MPLVQRPGDDWLGLLPGVEILNDAIELERREVFIEVVIYLHRRRTRAGADAFDFFERKNPIRGRFLMADVQPLSDFRDHFVADAAVFILRIHQHGNQRAALHRIAALQQFKFRRKLRGKLHGYLSTSPRTISIVPMHATTSAINCPSINFGSACRLIYDGERKCARRGFGEPSLAIKQPSSPRGDSTLTYASPGGGENPSVKILKW